MAKVACMVVMSMVVAAMMAGNAQSLSCGTVASDLYPCLSYVRNGGGIPPVGCCDGIKSLYGSAATTADRQDVCNCMKNAAASVPGVNMDLAAASLTNVALNFPTRSHPPLIAQVCSN